MLRIQPQPESVGAIRDSPAPRRRETLTRAPCPRPATSATVPLWNTEPTTSTSSRTPSCSVHGWSASMPRRVHPVSGRTRFSPSKMSSVCESPSTSYEVPVKTSPRPLNEYAVVQPYVARDLNLAKNTKWFVAGMVRNDASVRASCFRRDSFRQSLKSWLYVCVPHQLRESSQNELPTTKRVFRFTTPRHAISFRRQTGWAFP